MDRAVANSLRQRFDLGLFDPKEAYDLPGVDDVGTDASHAMSLRASQEAIVLLRNDDALLPLKSGGRIAVLGPHAGAQKVLMQPYPFSPFCPDHTNDCLVSPYAAIASLGRRLCRWVLPAPQHDADRPTIAYCSQPLGRPWWGSSWQLRLGRASSSRHPHACRPRADDA